MVKDQAMDAAKKEIRFYTRHFLINFVPALFTAVVN
jgi:hypothetical protein